MILALVLPMAWFLDSGTLPGTLQKLITIISKSMILGLVSPMAWSSWFWHPPLKLSKTYQNHIEINDSGSGASNGLISWFSHPIWNLLRTYQHHIKKWTILGLVPPMAWFLDSGTLLETFQKLSKSYQNQWFWALCIQWLDFLIPEPSLKPFKNPGASNGLISWFWHPTWKPSKTYQNQIKIDDSGLGASNGLISWFWHPP